MHRDEAAEQDEARVDPAHALADRRRFDPARAGAPQQAVEAEHEFGASSAKQIGSGASSHHSGNTRFLMVSEPSRQLSSVISMP